VRQIFPVYGQEFAAVTAVTPGPAPAAVQAIATLYGNVASPATAVRPRVRANMVESADGGVSLNGRSAPLSGPADRMVFAVLRSLADVILVGAGTARTEHYRPVRDAEVWAGLRAGLPPTPAIAVVTGSLDLDACARLLTDAPAHARTIVLTTAAAPAKRRAALDGKAIVIVAGQQRVDIARVVAALADLGHRNILVEGGPSLLGQIAAADMLDELCLTISPVLAGGRAGRIVAQRATGAAGHRLKLAHLLADESYLLCKYMRDRD
jgi:riboflavin biosynthesis pyrimidine reductase